MALYGTKGFSKGAQKERQKHGGTTSRVPSGTLGFWYPPYVGLGNQKVRSLCLCGPLGPYTSSKKDSPVKDGEKQLEKLMEAARAAGVADAVLRGCA